MKIEQKKHMDLSLHGEKKSHLKIYQLGDVVVIEKRINPRTIKIYKRKLQPLK